MAHDNIEFYGSRYVDSISSMDPQLPSLNENYSTLRMTFGYLAGDEVQTGPLIPGSGLDQFLKTFNKDTNPILSFENFCTKLNEYAAAHGPGTFPMEAFNDTLLETYITVLGHPLDWFNFGVDIYTLANFSGNPAQHPNMYSPSNPLRSQSIAWIEDFIEHYPYESDGSVGNFFGKLDFTTTQTANLHRDDGSGVPNGLPSYLGVWQSLMGAWTHEEQSFQTLFYAFVNQKITEDGYFIPSQNFLDWKLYLAEQLKIFEANPFTVQVNGDKTIVTNAAKTKVLDTIYNLIANLLASLQGIALAQANRLTLLTRWQKAYTDSIAQIHVFLQGDGTLLGASGTVQGSVRGDLNDKVNTNFRDIMQNNRSIISDDAKALQSNINQTNDAVQQQASMATSIIQQLSTILSAIYR